jgi:hypothetical protein
VAQALGHDRLVVGILAGFLKSLFSIFSLSLGQVACSHVLGGFLPFFPIMDENRHMHTIYYSLLLKCQIV